MKYLTDILKEFWTILAEMSPYLLFGFAVAGLISAFISADTVRRHLGKSSFWAVVKASLFGVPLPLCSCGVLPVTISLQKSGASKGACVAFLLSTPQTGVDSIFVTYSLLGIVFAVIRPVMAFVTGLVGGVAANLIDGKPIPPQAEQKKCCCCNSGQKQTDTDTPQQGAAVRIYNGLKYGFVTLPKDSASAMLIGLIAAALLTAVIPDDFFSRNLGSGPLSLLVMACVGMPIYVCSSASVPIAAAMILKGLSPGAALVFLMSGPAANSASLAIVWKQFGPKVAVTYIATILICSIGSGMFVNYLAFDAGVPVLSHSMFMLPVWLRNISAAALLILLVKSALAKRRSKKPD